MQAKTNANQPEFPSNGGLELPLPETSAAEGQAVIYGIRPEHIQIGGEGVPMKIIVVEPTGYETQIFAKSGSELIDALVQQRISARAGDTLGFTINPSAVHLFDGKTKARL